VRSCTPTVSTSRRTPPSPSRTKVAIAVAAVSAGLGDAGAVRTGLAPYTNQDDVDRLVSGVAELSRRR